MPVWSESPLTIKLCDHFLKFVLCFILLAIVVLATSSASAQSHAHNRQPTYLVVSAAIGEQTLLTEGTKTDIFERYHLLPCEFSNSYPVAGLALSSSDRPDYKEPIRSLTEAARIVPVCQTESNNPRYHLETSISFDLAGVSVLPFPSDSLFSSFGQYSQKSLLDAATAQESFQGPREGFHWWPALQQSFNFLLIEHGFRIATDPFLRYLLWHKPFWHDWAASNQHFFFNQWGDGDDFIVNYIGHPLEGAVTGNIEIVNDPRGRSLTFGRSRAYWMSRLRAMAWAAVYSAQFEAGPILSESAIGNEGGYFYKPGCDPYLSCTNQGNKPITNNTGWVDFVVTPLIGTGWILLEDSIEAELTDRFAPNEPDEALKWKMMRAALSPGHVMANFVAGKVPWYRYRIYGPDDGNILFGKRFQDRPKFTFEGVKRWEVGVHYTYLSLPVDTETCISCRVSNSGFGVNTAYRITNRLWVDSDLNYFPGTGSKGSLVQGMFGPRYGYTGKSWAWYFKLRPGFIYYDKTLTAESGNNLTEATRFAFDVGSVFEWFTSQHSAIRFDAGTTVVRYLTGRSDPRQPPGNILSDDYIVAQSNFQFSTGYTYRF
jgi:hypothetical protein